jgi:phage tail-like protein
MGRAAATDPLHNFRFHAKMVAGTGSPVAGIPGASPADVLQPSENGAGFIAGGNVGAEAGFQSITMPDVSAEVAEYREGNRTYTMKFPGVPSVTDSTFQRGVARYDTAFYSWLLAAIEGDEYRADVTVYHVQRPRRTLDIVPGAGGKAFMAATELAVSDVNTKRYILREAFPMRVKLAGDLDSTASDISISEMDVAAERIDLELPTAA